MMRLHFYAGVLIGPFILVAALTGALYAAAPTIERVVYGDVLSVDATGSSVPLTAQVAAAQQANPGLSVTGVRPPASATDSTRIYFADPALGEEKLRAVFVDPYSGKVLGSEPTWFGYLPLSSWLDGFHSNLQLGETGALYSELAASWLWVVALGGLYLWWRRFRQARARGRRGRFFGVDRSVTGRARTVHWHGAAGVWILVVLVFLSATGITWSTHAGEHVTELRTAMSWERPDLATSLPAASDAAGGHAGHSMATPTVDFSTIDFDRVVAVAAAAGVRTPLEVTLPSEPGQAISVAEIEKPYRLSSDAVAIDPTTMQIAGRVDYDSDYSLMAKLADWGIRAHMGFLFGFLNQLLLLVVALTLVTVIIRGYRMWWQRRPTRGGAWGVGRAPRRGGIRQIPWPAAVVLVAAAVAVGWFLPLLGWTLLAFLVVDAALALIAWGRHRTAAEVSAARKGK